MKNVLKSSLFAVVAIALASLTSYNASAVDLTQSVNHVYSYYPTIMCQNFEGTGYLYMNSNTCVFGQNVGGALQGRGLSYIKSSNINIVAGDYYEVFLDIAASDGAQSHVPVIWTLHTTANYDITDFSLVSSVDNLGSSAENEAFVSTYRIILKANYSNSSFPIELGYPNGGYNFIYLAGDSTPYSVDVRLNRINQYHATGSLSVSDITRAINQSEVNSSLTVLNNTALGLRSDLNDVQTMLEDINDNQGRVADVAEDEYNQTQEDREQASSDANGFSFNFSIPNPFSIFQVSDGCASTPTIDSWLHLEGDWKSPHCPIIPANVRNTLTPVVTLIVCLAVLMVVIRWVSGRPVDVSDNIGIGFDADRLAANAHKEKLK